MTKLVPIYVQELLPGDSIKVRSETLIRFGPMLAPVMHNIRISTHYFFVPNRIIYPDWEKFISPDLSKATPPAWPHFYVDAAQVAKGQLSDYMGVPPGNYSIASGQAISALPFAAYQKVCDEYYRDQNLLQSFFKPLVSGAQLAADRGELLKLRSRAWQHDYFTSALPFAQKGPAVSLPLVGTEDPIGVVRDSSVAGTYAWDTTLNGAGQESTFVAGQALTDTPSGSLMVDPSDLNLGAATINDLRVAFRLQEFFEKAARGGTRYIEQLKVHFNVNSSDKRLNRPEFLGGTINPVIISEVLQTSETTSNSPQGDMAGHGIAANSGRNIRYFAEEHGFIIGIQSIMPTTAYQQGLPKMFTRTSWQEYAWPTFAHLGEQPILNKEIYYDPSDGKNDDVFGYIPRYSEYRYMSSRVAGEFRDSMSFWHLGRIFANRPLLNQQFIYPQSSETNRIFAVQSNPNHLFCHTTNVVDAVRPLPKYGSPTL